MKAEAAGQVLSRCFRIFVAYVTACIVTTVILMVPFALRLFAIGLTEGSANGMAFALWFSFFLTLGVGLLPALLFVGYAEWKRKRSPTYFVLAGVVASVAPAVFVLMDSELELSRAESFLWAAITVVAGALAGVTYWLVAGRESGGAFVDIASAEAV